MAFPQDEYRPTLPGRLEANTRRRRPANRQRAGTLAASVPSHSASLTASYRAIFAVAFVFSILLAYNIVQRGDTCAGRAAQACRAPGVHRVLNASTTGSNPVVTENQKPGDPTWQITNPSLNGEIQGYASRDSINIGQQLSLYVSVNFPTIFPPGAPPTPAPQPTYSVDIYRLGYYGGAGARHILSLADTQGISQGYYPLTGLPLPNPVNCPACIGTVNYVTSGTGAPPPRVATKNPSSILYDSKGQFTYVMDANWQVTNSFRIPTTWVSGLFVARLTEHRAGTQWYVPFVVRDDARPADLVLQDPFNTDQAYNLWGGVDAYDNYRKFPGVGHGVGNQSYPWWGFYISYNRPYYQNFGAGNLFYWTIDMDWFLEKNGYDVTYTTNNAVALGQTNLLNYTGFLSAGHDEYVTHDERSQIDAAVNNGVSVAYFGGNNIYWQARSMADLSGAPGRILIEYKDYYAYPPTAPWDPYDVAGNPNRYLTTTLWRATPVNNPEGNLTNTMTPLGAQNSTLSDFVAVNTGSWVYNGTGLHDGSTIPHIVGSEIESYYPQNAGEIPWGNITIIGQSPFTGSNGTVYTANAVLDELYTPSQNIIFSAGTIDWPRGLATIRIASPPIGGVPPPHTSAATPGPQTTARNISAESAALEQMTNNILTRIVSGPCAVGLCIARPGATPGRHSGHPSTQAPSAPYAPQRSPLQPSDALIQVSMWLAGDAVNPRPDLTGSDRT